MKVGIKIFCLLLLMTSMPSLADLKADNIMQPWRCAGVELSAVSYSDRWPENKKYGANNIFLTVRKPDAVAIQLEGGWVYSAQCMHSTQAYLLLHRWMPGQISDALYAVVDLSTGQLRIDFPADNKHGDSASNVEKLVGRLNMPPKCAARDEFTGSPAKQQICFAEPEIVQLFLAWHQ